jgi:alanine racemase
MMQKPSEAGGRLAIDLDALVANWRAMAARAPGSTTAAVVKGDAYGIGIAQAVPALATVGCSTYFVALPDEGFRVRAAAPASVVYILGGLIGAPDAYVAADLRPVLNSPAEVAEWRAVRAAGAATAAAIHVDTGMNRLGLDEGAFRALAAAPDAAGELGLTLLMSHLACADTPGHPLNRRQLDAFRAARAVLPAVPASLANSAGTFLGADYHFDLVRPGIALYGGRAVNGAPNPMRPVAALMARILQVRTVPAGETVGYGAAETVSRESRIAIVGVGYADGYLRAAGGADGRRGASAHVGGRAVPLVGRVSMDLIALDVTDVPGVERGDWAELFGANVAVDDVADRAGTIGYEYLTGLGSRYARTYAGPAN